MDISQIFHIEKNNDDIRKTVLKNIIKMLTTRKLLNSENLEKNIKMIQSAVSDEYVYTIVLDNPKNSNDKTFIVKILHQKITAVSKQSPISDFLNKYKFNSKLVVVRDIGTKAKQQIMNNFPNTEVFLESNLMINLFDYSLVPKHELLPKDSDETEAFYKKYRTKKKNMPRIDVNDPVARYFNMKKGDLCKITRPSETSGFVITYRLVV